MTAAVKAAAWYAKRGWPVLPVHYPTDGRCSCGNPGCTRIGKHPALPNGIHGASATPAVVAGWWSQGRPWNVGLATGAGFWVLDVDGPTGCAGMAKAELTNGKLPPTVTAETGGGGLHLLWNLPDGARAPSRVAVLPGVDVRGAGGFIVAPPSLHLSGKSYTWHQDRGPHQVAIAEAPPWLLDLALGRGQGHGERTNWGEAFRAKVPNGERNHAVAKRAGYLLRLGVDRDAATELLTAWSRDHLQPPLSATEIRRTIGSIARREQRKAR